MSTLLKKIKTYNKITNFVKIARRYFINNFYDGALTVLGIILGFFVIIFKNPENATISSTYIILPSVGTAISMFISGVSGSYLSEKAERKRIRAELNRAMAIVENQEEDKEDFDTDSQKRDFAKAMLKEVDLDQIPTVIGKKKKKIKSLYEKAETFTATLVAIVNGGAPFLGGVIPIIPFLFVEEAGIISFIISFIIIFICIVVLGIYLGCISQESIIKNIIQMLIAFILTMTIVLFFLS
jgi:VIT1/CCC1 family predicted Fe2+/Mn2+ transporter